MPDSLISNNTEHPDNRGDIWHGEVHPELLAKKKPVGPRRRYTQAEVIEALQVSRGLKSMAARHLRCHLATVEHYCKRYPQVAAECEAQRQAFVDTAYLQLMTKVNQGDLGAVMFVLKTLGRDRGFSERTEVTGKDGGPIAHTHIHLWEERLQAVHAQMAEKKAAIVLEKQAGGGYETPRETA